MVKSLPIIGVCRFSYLGFSDWRSHTWRRGDKSNDQILDETRQTLFSPERLERRFETFENLTLPSLGCQTNGDFRFIVLTSDELPKQYADRLRDVCSQYPFVELVFAPAGNVKVAVNQTYLKMGHRLKQIIQFRLDDDDAVGQNYIKRLRKLADTLYNAEPARSFAITFPSVLVVTVVDGNLKFYFRHMLHTSAGQAMFHRGRNVLDWAHHRVARGVMSLSDYYDQWVLQSFLTGVNDSGPLTPSEMRRRGLEELAPEKVTAICSKHFPFMSIDQEWWASMIR